MSDPRGPFFLTQWERDDYERQRRGDPPRGPLAGQPTGAIQDALCDAAQFIDAVRQDAIREGWWTDWDQAMREKITAALQALNNGQSTGE